MKTKKSHVIPISFTIIAALFWANILFNPALYRGHITAVCAAIGASVAAAALGLDEFRPRRS